HLGELRHVGNPDIGRKELALVGPGASEQSVDLREDALDLLGHVFAFGAVGNDAREIHGVAVHHRLAHARRGLVTFDLHKVVSLLNGLRIRPEAEAGSSDRSQAAPDHLSNIVVATPNCVARSARSSINSSLNSTSEPAAYLARLVLSPGSRTGLVASAGAHPFTSSTYLSACAFK